MTWTRPQLVATAVALAFFAAAAGFAVGAEVAGDDRPSANSSDATFLLDMTAHHEQAIQMSILELRHGDDPAIETFAREILYQQGYEIGAMERQLEGWGITLQGRAQHAMAGMATDDEMEALGHARGRDADALFVRLMQDHHRGGVAMAEEAASKATTRFVRDLATRQARNQRIEIQEMERALGQLGLPASPAGWTPDRFGASDDHAHDG